MTTALSYQIGANGAHIMAEALQSRDRSWNDLLDAAEVCAASVILNVITAAVQDDALHGRTQSEVASELLFNMARNALLIVESALDDVDRAQA